MTDPVTMCEYCGARDDRDNPHGDPGTHGPIDYYLVPRTRDDDDIPCPVGTNDDAAWDALARALITRIDEVSAGKNATIMELKRALTAT